MGKAKAKAKRAAHAEHRATAAAARHRHHPLVDAAGTVSDVADQPPLIALSLAMLGGGVLLRRPAIARAGARMLASHLLATGIKTLVKQRVDRTRPGRALADGRHRVGKGNGAQDGELNSFPSGHTAGAVAVAQAASRDLPRAAIPARAAAAGVGAMQVPRGAHYLTDVAVGAAIGWLSEKIASAALDAAERALRQRHADSAERTALEESAAHPS